MRDIKFRIWDERYKCYWYKYLIGNSNDKDFELQTANAVYVTPDKVDYYVPKEGQWSNFENNDQMIIEQYTGLKDKNGNEIYEGDILNWKHFYVYGNTDGVEKIAPVVFRNGAFKSGKYSKLVGDFNRQMPCEIIGNIHENPEKLEGLN